MTDAPLSRPAGRSGRAKQIVWFVVGLLIVVAIFAFAIPRFADWSAVWAAMKTLTFIVF